MAQALHQALEELGHDLLRMGTLVEDSITRAVAALKERDVAAAEAVIADDDKVDQMEHDIEKRCLNLLALQQPMGSDLRRVGTALKIITDLERMGDHAVDIAKVVVRLGGQPLIKPLIDLPRMAELSQTMLREALTAYVTEDKNLALAMIERDHEVDHLYSQVFRELLTYMLEDPRTVNQGLYLIFVAMYLERVADHATNLGEWVLYMLTGERRDLND